MCNLYQWITWCCAVSFKHETWQHFCCNSDTEEHEEEKYDEYLEQAHHNSVLFFDAYNSQNGWEDDENIEGNQES